MINQENFHFYLRYLVKLTDKKPIQYDEIPKAFQDFFTLPALSQALNISIRHPPPVNYSKVEKYIDEATFDDFDSLVNGIKNTFDSMMDRLYAIYYYSTHTIMYDYERFEQEDREYMPDDVIFKVKKGVCAEYAQFFVHVAKKVGITNKVMIVEDYTNVAKAQGYDFFNPPKDVHENKKLLHASVFIEINGEKFLSEPTWAAGHKVDGVFKFDYNKTNFLLPFYVGLIDHFPYKSKEPQSIYCPFSWKQYISINTPDFEKEVSLESNPFQRFTVKNGIFEMQFSYIQPCDSPFGNFKILKDNEWVSVDSVLYTVTCIDKDIPNHNYSFYPDKKRNRYKITICFPEKGSWAVSVFDPTILFKIFLDVEKTSSELPFIPGRNKEENGFYPITPLIGLTKIEKGSVRIRFAIKEKRSPLLIELYKIKKGTFERENDNCIRNCDRCFTVEIPNEIYDNKNNINSSERLVEDFVLIDFPDKGRWEVYIYFKNDSGSFNYGVKYFFDVNNFSKDDKNMYSIYDLPKGRQFVPSKSKEPEKCWLSPSPSVVIITDFYFNFHVFSQEEKKVYFDNVNEPKSNTIWPTLISAKETGKDEIIDREYSVTFPSYGHYELYIWASECIQRQQYFLIDFDLPDESYKEKKLMGYLVDQLKFPPDYTSDIPKTIEKRVDQMMLEALQEKEEKEENSDDDDDEFESDSDEVDQEEISFLMDKAKRLEKEKEDFNKKFEEMKKKKDQMKLDFLHQIDQLRKEWEKKEEKEKQEKNERSKLKNIEYDKNEKQLKEKYESKMAELRTRISKIEEQLNIDPDKRNELVKLHKELLKEEENEIFTLSSNRQKKQDEIEKDEENYKEMARQDEEKKNQILQQKKDEFQQKILNTNDDVSTSIKVQDSKTDDKNKIDDNDQSNNNNKQKRSNCCLLI